MASTILTYKSMSLLSDGEGNHRSSWYVNSPQPLAQDDIDHCSAKWLGYTFILVISLSCSFENINAVPFAQLSMETIYSYLLNYHFLLGCMCELC